MAPYNKMFNIAQNDTKRDCLHAVVNESLTLLGLLLLPFLEGVITVIDLWPDKWPLTIQLLLAIVIADTGITLMHYASHHYSILWRFHAVHHSVKRMYGFNGLMKHPIHQLLETGAGVIPLLLIGVSVDILAVLAVAVVIQLLLQHSNVNYFYRPFHRILALNVVHRLHHLNTKEGNVNFGLFTTLMDRVLGSARIELRDRISMSDIGIATQPNYPVNYLEQLTQPFAREGALDS